MKNTDAKTTALVPVRRRSLLRNVRGAAEITQTIILTVALALGCLAAVQALKGKIGEKMDTTGQAIQGIQ
ncbi:MAG TPA: hypothetical protein VK698_14225 [Kofleriaceae bacterium]|nr:hypothetical protein [Kofleriaceae bacterium]